MDGLEDLTLTISERLWADLAPERGDATWTLTIPGSVTLQLRPFNGPGNSLLVLHVLTTCCRASVKGSAQTSFACRNCNQIFPHPTHRLRIERLDGVGSWTMAETSRSSLRAMMEYDLEPLAADVQISRVIDVLLELFDKLDAQVIPLLRDRRARLPLQKQTDLFGVVIDELREEHEWLELI